MPEPLLVAKSEAELYLLPPFAKALRLALVHSECELQGQGAPYLPAEALGPFRPLFKFGDPRHRMKKRYLAQVERIPDAAALALRRGVKLRDGMTAAVGHPTLRLVRASIGAWSLDGLRPGEWEVRR